MSLMLYVNIARGNHMLRSWQIPAGVIATGISFAKIGYGQNIMLRTITSKLVAPTKPLFGFSAVRAAGSAAAPVKIQGNYNSPDNNYTADRLPVGDADGKRAFTYFVLGSAKFIYASAARLIVIKGIASLSASADVLAMASLEVDLGNIKEGDCVTVKWRGKPVFVKHRSSEQIADVAGLPGDLRDPQTDAERTQDPKW
jgi:hypothetical protein